MSKEPFQQKGRPKRSTLGNILLVVGALVIVAPLGVAAYDEIMWRWEMRQYAEAPSPVLLTPVGEAATTPPPAPGETENPSQFEPPPRSEDLPLLRFDRARGLPTYQIEIPKLGITYLVGEGIDNQVLAKGPGHYPQTVLPGEVGNAALAAHRTVRGRPAFFYSIDELQPGDEIRIGYRDKTLIFQVERSFLTTPFDLGVLAPTAYPSLTLTTCDPPGGDEQRLIVQARLTQVKERS
jgi:sortase A